MRLGFRGERLDEPVLRAGFIGCGSHAFRNVYPALQFAPVQLAAVCDLRAEQAEAFAAQFGAQRVYTDHRTMLDDGGLDAVFIVTNADEHGRPRYPGLVADCVAAGCHAWIEKPPAATCAEVEAMQAAAAAADKLVMVGFKKAFGTANQHARALMCGSDFGRVQLVQQQYPLRIPEPEELRRYLAEREPVPAVTGFLDLCHPASLLTYLLGMPTSLFYQRSPDGAGLATFTFADGAVASLALCAGAPYNGGVEHTTILGNGGRRIVIENNLRVWYHRDAPAPPGSGYGATPSSFYGEPGQASTYWEPEMTLGQLYNKALFLQGFQPEIEEFARVVLEHRPPSAGTLRHAWQVTRLFEAFSAGPGQPIDLAEPDEVRAWGAGGAA